MYAGIVTGSIQSGKADEFNSKWQETVLPDLSREPGFQGVYLMKDEAESKFVALVLWQSEADAKASEHGFAQQRLPRVTHLLSGKPVSETFEVVLRA